MKDPSISTLYRVLNVNEAGQMKVRLMVRLIESGNASEIEVEKARLEIAEAILG